MMNHANNYSSERFSSICSSPHSYRAFSAGISAEPLSVREYSTFGGISLYCFLLMSPLWHNHKPFRKSPFSDYGAYYNNSISPEICSHKHFSGLFFSGD